MDITTGFEPVIGGSNPSGSTSYTSYVSEGFEGRRRAIGPSAEAGSRVLMSEATLKLVTESLREH